MPPWWWQKVIVSQPADTSSWRGNPGQYVISCAYHVGQREVKGCSYTTDAKATSITLPRLENAHSYDVFMIMRNMEGKSSTRRLFHVIKKVQGEWWKRAECHVRQMQMKCKAWIFIATHPLIWSFFAWMWYYLPECDCYEFNVLALATLHRIIGKKKKQNKQV